MWPLHDSYIQAKNRLSDPNAWLLLAKIEASTGTLRFACNARGDLIWNGQEWLAMPAEIDSIADSKTEVPQVQVRICNVDRMVQAQIEPIDGAVDSTVTFYTVYTGHLEVTANVPALEFEITGARCDAKWGYFTLGVTPNPLDIQDPKDLILKNFCRFGYPHTADPRCPYTGGAYTACNRTLANCQQRNGALARRFGGFPAIGTNRLYVD